MPEKKKLTKEEFEAERSRLSQEVKKATKALWDHVHPVIEDPFEVAQQAAWEVKKAERAKSAKKEKK